MPTITKYASDATVVSSTWGTTANAAGSTVGDFATWASTTANDTGVLDLGGYNFSADIPTGSTIDSISVTIRSYVSNTSRMLAPQATVMDGSTVIGSTQTMTSSTSSTNQDVFSLTMTEAQLRSSNLKVRFTARRANNTQAATTYLDFIGVTVAYTEIVFDTTIDTVEQTVFPWLPVTLTSNDVGNWTQVSGTSVVLSGSGSTRSFTIPPSMTSQVLEFSFEGAPVKIHVPAARNAIKTAVNLQPVNYSKLPLGARAGAVIRPAKPVTKKYTPATVRSFTQKGESGGATGSINRTISGPSPSPVAGDVLIFAVMMSSGSVSESGDMTMPVGFSQLGTSFPDSTTEAKLRVGYKIATASEPASYAYTVPTAYSHRADLICVRDVDMSRLPAISSAFSPGGASPLIPNNTGSNPDYYNLPAVSPLSAHGLLLSGAGTRRTSASTSHGFDWDWSGSGGMTEVTDSVGNNLVTMSSASQAWASKNTVSGRTVALNRSDAEDRPAVAYSLIIPSKTTIVSGTGASTPVVKPTVNYSGGVGGPLIDLVNQSFTSNGITSQYHLYASGLDWNKRVGILIYTDGSGEFGLKRPENTYLMAGENGIIAKAKKHNMVLLTLMAPGDGCTDDGGVCWYANSYDGTTPETKLAWAYQVVKYIYSRYNIDKRRVVVGGYSSGAQFTTQYFGPAHLVEFMNDGVAVPISYGGPPKVASTYNSAIKSAVPIRWVVGDQDISWTGQPPTYPHGIPAGMDWYSTNGFNTSVRLLSGVGHTDATFISGQFGNYLDDEITAHVPPATFYTPETSPTYEDPNDPGTFITGMAEDTNDPGTFIPTLTADSGDPGTFII